MDEAESDAWPVAAVVSRWPRHPRSVGQAREGLRKTLAAWELSDAEDAALLVLSELLGNAVVHGRVPRGREVETRYLRMAYGVRIEVHDTARELPRSLPLPDGEMCSGRGLFLVEAVADRWGVTRRTGPGKAVWAEVAAPRSGAGA
ncbi:ATP-binding protein [Streptomyces longisporoflavus]|uniref:ATP-binding protein n=1 Tax=Streptomyces longisporoflavus TaxID=28044 RepID=A0ABW7QZG5_9ACTN